MGRGIPLIIFLIFLTGCSAPVTQPTDPSPLPPQDGGFIQPPGGALEAQRLLSRELNVAAQTITIQSIDSIEWQDSCLEAGEPGEVCEPQRIPGLQITLRHAGNNYVYHSNLDGSLIRKIRPLGEPSSAALIAIQYLAGLLGYDPGAIQRLGDRPTLFADDCLEITIAEVPCTYLPVQGQVIHLGVDQRIYEFRMALNDSSPVLAAVDGNSTAIPALNWGREGSAMQYCDGLKIYLNGWLVQYNCRGQASQQPGFARLTPENQSQLLRWFISLQPFEHHQTALDGSLVRMYFNGVGLENVDIPLQLQVSEFAAGLLVPVRTGTVTPAPFLE